MTQYQQVLSAVKRIGGKGTTDEIFKAIDGIENWSAKNKKASVASYLSRSYDFRKEGDNWIYEENTASQDTANKNSNDTTERGLYFITLNPSVKPPIAGLLFKIGLSDGKVRNRLKSYSASLPYNPIQELSFYRIPIDVDLRKVEEQVSGELLGNDSLGFRVEKFFSSTQIEWLQTLDLSLSADDINKLAVVVDKIIKETIDNLRKENDGEAP